MDNLVMTMPAVALRGMTILPGMIAHFDISREKSLKAIEEAMRNDQKVFLVTQKDVEQENPGLEDLYQIGIIAEVRQVIKMQNNVVRILVEGTSRAKVCGFTEETEYLKVEIEVFESADLETLPEETKQAMLQGLLETFFKYAKISGKISVEMQRQINGMDDLEKLLDYIPNNMPVSYKEKQKILEAVDLVERYEVQADMGEVEALEQIAKIRSCKKAGDELDLDKAASLLMDDFRSGKLGTITLETAEDWSEA